MRMHLAAPHRAKGSQNAHRKNARSPNPLENHFYDYCHYINALIDSISRRTTIDILTCSGKPIAPEHIRSSGKLGNFQAIAYHQTQVNLKRQMTATALAIWIT